MKGHAVKLSLPENVYDGIEDAARRTERTLVEVAGEMLAEAVKMRRVPGIVFADGIRGRVARIAGTGLDVWEIVAAYRTANESWELLKADFDWLSEQQLHSALAYAEAYPEEIEEALRDNATWTPEKTWATYSFMRPPGR
jgi:uncharacterized protein (DUF433 family)